MQDNDFFISKTLSRMDLNTTSKDVYPLTYWCRTVHSKYEMWNTKPHSHTFWELHLCLSGSCEIESGDTKFLLTERKFLLFAPRQKHTVLSQSPDFCKFVWGFSVPDEALQKSLLSAYRTPALQEADEELLHSISLILENTASRSYGFHSIIKAQLHSIFLALARQAGCAEHGEYEKTHSEEMAQITEYIRENLAANITTDDVSAAFFAGKGRIERLCKAEYGMTFAELKRKLQTEQIRKLLQEDDLTIDEIARQTGFADRYSMGKFFKKAEGMPPVQYRKSFRK
ncbi:MAG: helix-turn-helix transcriptional regulator [Clostridia bacterium]|nr:helix-turn-helix transcriptional regulator [Clostridia bacterium]